MTENQDVRKTVKVLPEVKEALVKLKEEWGLSSESDVISALVDHFHLSETIPKAFLDSLYSLRK